MWISSHIGVVMFIICTMEKVFITHQEWAGVRLADIDHQPPKIKCPDDVKSSTDPSKPTRKVAWNMPVATDNTGNTPTIDTYPPWIVSPHAFPIGSTRTFYTATDQNGNAQSCVFTVTITDDESPTLTCPKDIEVKKTTAGPTVTVHWHSPIYEDNSGEAVILFSESIKGSGFKVGKHQIKYEATDRSGNKAFCTFTITVSGPTCRPYAPPLNGLLACVHSDFLSSTVCTPQCHLNTDFSRIPANMYICQSTGEWYPFDARPTVSRKLPWPDCTDVVKPGSSQKGTNWQNLAGDCSDPAVQIQAKQNLLQGVVSVFWDMGLMSRDVKIACGKTTAKKQRSLLVGQINNLKSSRRRHSARRAN